MAHLTDLDLTAPADSLFSGGTVLNTWRTRIDALNDVLGDITTAEANQVENIATTTISAAQWGYLGACSAGGGQLLAALTASESTQLEAIGATTISLAQWGYLGACGAGGGQLLAALTTGESTQLEAIGSVTITNTQWGYLGALNQGLTTTSTVTFGTINAFTLGGKLTAGASEIEGTGFDINGGTIAGVTLDGAIAGGDQGITGVGDMTFTAGSILAAAAANTSTLLIKAGGLAGTSVITITSLDAGDTLGLANITSLVASGNLDIGAHGFTANTLTADGLTAGRLVRAGTAGLLSDATVTESSGALGGITTLSMTGNLTVGGTVDGVDVAALKTDVDGFPDSLKNLDATEITELEAIGDTTISAAQWGYLGACTTGGGQLLAALTTGESTQLEAIDSTTISATQWGYLGAATQGIWVTTAKARAYMAAEMLDVTSDSWTKVDLDTETYDPGSNFSVALLGSGTADGTTGGHLIDSGYDFAAAGITAGMRIKNTTDTTYTYITAVAVGDLTVRDDIFVSGETWEVKGGRFTAPANGYYLFTAQIWWKHGTVVGDKRIYVSIKVNGTTRMMGQVHSAWTGSLGTAVLDNFYLSQNDFVTLWGNAATDVNTTDIDDGSEKTFMAIHYLSD